MRITCVIHYLITLFLLSTTNVKAQEKEFVYKNYTQEEGLPSNETYTIFKDSKNYLWIATDNGVVRYNGNKFQQYNLPDNVVFQIREDSKGRIWFFCHTGKLAYFENEKIYPFKYNNILMKHFKNLHIKDAYVDSSGTIFINSSIQSSYIIKQDGTIKTFPNSYYITQTYMQVDVKENNKCFTQMIKNCIGGADTVFLSVNRGRQKQQYIIPVKHRGSSHYGSIINEQGDIYIFYSNFLINLKANGDYILKVLPKMILSMKIYDNILWVGMIKGGIQLFTKDLEPSRKNILLEGISVSCIENDYENGLWISTTEKGVYYIKNKYVKQLNFKDGQPVGISRVYNYNDSLLLYGNTQGIWEWQNEQSRLIFPINNTHFSGLWVSKNKTLLCMGGFDFFGNSYRGGKTGFKNIVCFNARTTESVLIGDTMLCSGASIYVWADVSDFFIDPSPDFPYQYSVTNKKIILTETATLFADNENNLWAGNSKGLYRSKSPYDTLFKVNAANTMLSTGINHITDFSNGILCAALRFGGVVLLRDSNVIASISEKNGLLSDKVNYVLTKKNQLWAATVKGISVINFTSFNPIQYSIINIGKNDGFYNVTINQLAQYKNNIVASTNNGIYFFENPDSLISQKTSTIPFYINTINSYRGDTANIESITLPYSNNSLRIRYHAISFNSYENIKFLYRFDYGDTLWHSTANNELIFENMEPGTYRLSIKAINDGQKRQSETKTFTIVIEKPWWQNNWFRLLCVLVVSVTVYLFVRNRIKKITEEEKKKTDLNAKLSELEQTALRSQMNPHFIFNCLTSIQQLIISGNKVDANEYLVKFSRLIRKTLDMSARPFISIAEEKNYLEEYLFLEQLRLSGRFDFNISADKSIDVNSIFIPNMMIQPVVENCVRHGIKSLENKKGAITVKFTPNKSSITCTITDNGVGRNSIFLEKKKTITDHKSYGMDIVRRRLETFSEFKVDESGIEINDLYDNDGLAAGTEVILHLPYKNTV